MDKSQIIMLDHSSKSAYFASRESSKSVSLEFSVQSKVKIQPPTGQEDRWIGMFCRACPCWWNTSCFIGTSLVWGQKRDKAYEAAQPEEGCSSDRVARMMSVRLTIRLISCKNNNHQNF
jgi:hypothetical protein